MKNLESTNAKTKKHRRSLIIDESIQREFRDPKYRGKAKTFKRLYKKASEFKTALWMFILVLAISGFFTNLMSGNFPSLKSSQNTEPECIWEICSIDTMKTSRDRARSELNNPAYDEEIKSQLKLIKQTGASYVSIATPYDAEFLPYLKRWVKLSRREGLKVWFRGNWSNWEGWFDYPKNMSPSLHTEKTKNFIKENSELFADGDIFDPCPECENSGFWPQNAKNADYNKFVLNQQTEITSAFKETGKNVKVYQSIIGGRAKDVLVKESFKSLGDFIAIDHYVKIPEVMEEFINYFWNNSGTKSLVSEFGAPIPDLNGPMNDAEQAKFIKEILEVLYKNRNKVAGLNYWVLSEGTTELIKEDGTPKPAFYVLQNYFTPGLIYGNIKNPLGENIKDIPVKTTDGISETVTDDQGNFKLSIPPQTIEIRVGDDNYKKQNFSVIIDKSSRKVEKNFTLTPIDPGIFYRLKLWWKNSTT